MSCGSNGHAHRYNRQITENRIADAAQSEEAGAGKRLDSWKEIAAFFGRDVRTAKRWEKEEKLPVHRHLHKSLASVYAYEGELEAWQKNRRAGSHPRRHGVIWATAAAVAVVITAALLVWWTRPPRLPFEQRDWALISQFENRTGETVFDGTVEYALEREISNSRFVNVVPRERIIDALRLMKRPPDTVVDRSVGREVCLRDGGVRALITGRVEKLDGTYLLSAALVKPETGVAVASFSEQAEDQRHVVGAIQRLSRSVREGLGEEWPSGEKVQDLERVSTTSLRALQLYSHGDALIRAHRLEQAVALLRDAVEEDPEFASAHVLLAHSLSNLGRREEAVPHFERALDLSKSSNDAERLFIQSSYEFLRDDHKAVQTLEILVRLHPDHYWAVSNLSVIYASIGQPRRARPYIVHRADLRPHNFDHQLRAAHSLLLGGEARTAEPYVERARLTFAGDDQDDPMRPWRAAWLRLYPIHAQWVSGDIGASIEEAMKLAAELDATAPEHQNALRWELGSFFLTTGKIDAANEIFQSMTGPPENLALIATALGDMQASQKRLRSAPASHRSAILMARSGMWSEAEQALGDRQIASRAHAPFIPAVWETLARGELAMARDQSAETIPLLQKTVQTLRMWPTPYFFLGVDALARAYQRQGNTEKGLEVLEDASEYGRAAVFWGPAPFFWMKNELRRAEIYRDTGREADRLHVHAGLDRLLTHADPDFPILRELDRGPAR